MGTLEELFPKHAAIRQRHGRHVLFEYVMLQGVNDSLEDARRLLVMTQDIECKFNLIGFNPHPGTRFRPSPPERVSWTPAHALPFLGISIHVKRLQSSLHAARACCRLVQALPEHSV